MFLPVVHSASSATLRPRIQRAAALCTTVLCALLLLAPVIAVAAPTASIQLSNTYPHDNAAFSVSGMMPGDTEAMRASVEVQHEEDIDVRFAAVLDAETQRLSEALTARITDLDTGALLYDASVAELVNGRGLTIPLPRTDAGVSTLHWRIEVCAPTSMTNEYQGASCELTLDWAVAYEDAPAPQPPQPGKPGGGILDNLPATGDIVMIALIILFCGLAFICMRAAAAETDDAVGSLPLPLGDVAGQAKAEHAEDESAASGPLRRVAIYLKHHKRIAAAALSIIFLLLAIATAWALFWAHATIPNNRFEMGSVAVDLNEGRPILPAGRIELEPGRTIVEELTVRNTGTAACFYRLHLSRLSGDLASALHVTISRSADGAVLYDGDVINLERADLCESPAALAPGATDTLILAVKMTEGSGNDHQGGSATFDVTLDAVQAKNNTGRDFS